MSQSHVYPGGFRVPICFHFHNTTVSRFVLVIYIVIIYKLAGKLQSRMTFVRRKVKVKSRKLGLVGRKAKGGIHQELESSDLSSIPRLVILSNAQDLPRKHEETLTSATA